MRFKTIKMVAGAFIAASLVSACGSAKNNPCVVWVADNGPYLALYTPKAGAPACAKVQYDTLELTQFPLKGTLAILPDVLATYDANAELINADTVIGNGTFDNGALVNDTNECTVPSVTTSTLGAGTPSYTFTNLRFYEAAYAQGSNFAGDLHLDDGAGCAADYSVQAIAPIVGCAADIDCAPLPQPGQALGSGLAPQYHTFCDLSAAATAFTGDAATGVCFFAEAYPSICADNALEGAAGSSCQLGK